MLSRTLCSAARLGEYKYYDMDKVIESALACVAVQMDKINQYKA